MAKCKTCGETIEVPGGWSVGPAVRRHYWAKHRDRMERSRADRQAIAVLEATPKPPSNPRRKPGSGPSPKPKRAP
jgi:hypothetical protein